MSDFTKKFLLEDPRRLSPTGRFVALAAFGKHPGWDDHIEPTPSGITPADLGLETESLNLAKTVLYINGIGGQIDSGAWEKLDTAQHLPAFSHVFLWQRPGQILLGRLWSSSDGKGRTRYPMVVCFHFAGVSIEWALKHGLPALAELEAGCVMTTSALEVKTLLARKRAALREAIQSSDGRGQDPLTPEALRNALPPAGDPKAEGFLRVLYQMQSQLGAFAPAAFDANTARAQQIRVPTAGANAQQTLLFWTRFFLTQVSASAPLLLVLPLEGGWVDVTVGEPESHEFFCLRASPKAVPLVSEVPYKLDEAFRASATAFLDSFRRGEPATAILQPATALVAEPSAPARAGWLRWLGVGVIIVLAAIAAVVLWPKDTKQQTASQPQSSPVPASSPKPVVKSDTPAPAPPASDTSTAEAARAKARLEAEAEAARQVEAKKQADALAAAAKLKADAEAAIQEKERQAAEAARLEKEKAAAAQKRLEDQQRQAADLAAAKVKSDQQAQAALQLAAIPASNTDLKPATASTSPVTPASGQITNSIGMVLVQLPSGLWVGKYEVTQAEYRKVMGANPSFWVDDRKPVEQVTWNDAVEFTHKLTELERSTLPAGRTYSLPTEIQWNEFLAGQTFADLPGGGLRGGSAGTSPVGQFGPANKFGLYDVLGNVWEWCLDDAPGGQKLLKGGAYNSANTNRTLLPDRKGSSCGFRCVILAP